MLKIKAATAALQTERLKAKIMSHDWKPLPLILILWWERLPAANMNHTALQYNYLCAAAKIFIHLFIYSFI